jgi:hypothetical protein
MRNYNVFFKRDSKSVFGKKDADLQRATVSAKSKTDAVTVVNARWATNGYTVRVLSLKPVSRV